MNYPITLATLAIIAGHLLSGCRPSVTTMPANASLGDIASLDIEIHDNYYGAEDTNLSDPPVWKVQRGADVLATVDNQGSLNHNWAVIKKDASISVPFTEGQSSHLIEYGAGMIYGKNRTTITFTAPKEIGEYLVICTVSGHYPSMQGRLVVE